jgi:hypothetical protein
VGASGKADKVILRMFKSVAEVVIRLGARVVLFTSDGDSTFLEELQALFNALTGVKERHVCLTVPLHAQQAVAAHVGGVPWLIDQHHSSKDVHYTMAGPGEFSRFRRSSRGSSSVRCNHRC